MDEQRPDANAMEAADEKYVMRRWAHPAGEPVIIAKPRGCTVTDVHGKEHVDLTAGYFVNNAGHCHPRIIEAVTRQLHEVLQVSGKHGTMPAIRLAEKLVSLAPGPPRGVLLDGSSEATIACKRGVTRFGGDPVRTTMSCSFI